MIHEIKIKNFLSFKDEVTFSFEATKGKILEDYYVREAAGLRLLRLALVYGANASGKSNLLSAFEFLKIFALNRSENKTEETGVIPFLLDKETPNQPSELSISFVTEGKRYLYSLVIDENIVHSEKLYVYPKTQPALVFERTFNNNVSEITFNTKRVRIPQIAKEEITIKCLPNMSVFAAYNQVNISIEDIDKVIEWIAKKHINHVEPQLRVSNFAEKVLAEKPEIKESILSFLKAADFNITDIITEMETRKIPEEYIDELLLEAEGIPNEEKERLRRERSYQAPKTNFKHRVENIRGEEFYNLPKELQSEGTKRIFGLAVIINTLVKSNAFLAIDEIESSLHPKLIEFLLEDFLKLEGESQLLLSTHYDGLLEEEDLLRKDSIWFTSKKIDGSTEIYSLTEFKGLNRIASLRKAYRHGNFGATPNIM